MTFALLLLYNMWGSIRRSVSASVFTSLIMPRLHCGNATLARLPQYQHHRLKSVLNAAARLIYQTSRCQHHTTSVTAFWLRSRQRVNFKLDVLILFFRCLHGLAPGYTDPATYVVSATPTNGMSVHHRQLYRPSKSDQHGRWQWDRAFLARCRQQTLEQFTARCHLTLCFW